MRSLPCFLLAACIALPTIALAQETPRETRYPQNNGELIVRWGETGYKPSGPAPEFAQLDTNGDGMISADEAKAYPLLANDFQMADSNRDGRISAAEYKRWKARP